MSRIEGAKYDLVSAMFYFYSPSREARPRLLPRGGRLRIVVQLQLILY